MKVQLWLVAALGFALACDDTAQQAAIPTCVERETSAPVTLTVPSQLAAIPDGAIVGVLSSAEVPYSCASVITDEGRALRNDEPVHPLTQVMLSALPIGASNADLAPAASVLARAALVPVAELTTRDRVFIQAAALGVARRGGELVPAALSVVRRMALDPGELSALGSDPGPDLEGLLGPADDWIERRGPSCGPHGAHDGYFAGQLAFRTVRAGVRRVLFAQVVAFDTELDPHVTPFVALVEMRTSMRADAPACVIEATEAGLEAMPFERLHASPFVRPTANGGVECGSCHPGNGPNDLSDLGREKGGAFRIERRIALLELARARRPGR